MIYKIAYLVASLIIALTMTFCLFETSRKATKIAKGVSMLILTAFICQLVFCLTLVIQNELIAKCLFVFYFFTLDAGLYALLSLICIMAEYNPYSKMARIVRISYFSFCLLDFFVLCINIFYPFQYSIVKHFSDTGYFLCWIIDIHPAMYFHFVLCYLIVGQIIVTLIKFAKKAGYFYGRKYYSILVLFFITIVCNVIYLNFETIVKFDFSLVFYSCMTIVAFGFSLYSVPRSVQKKLLQIASKNISDGVLCFDLDNRLIYTNKIGKVLYDQTIKEGNESWLWKYLNSTVDDDSQQEVLNYYDEKRVYTVEFHRLYDRKERKHTIEKKYAGCYLKINDRTTEYRSMEKEAYRATHDELTGLYNRNYFFTEMEKILARNPTVPRYLVCADIQKFKLVNDLFGTSFGDSILKNLASQLLEIRYAGCIHGRISGDKYAVLISKEDFKLNEFETAVENIKDYIERINFQLKTYIGIYEIGNAFENVHTMYDKAMLAIKSINPEQNKNVAFYDSSLMKKIMDEKNILSEFKYAIANNQFLMYLQPQINSLTGEVSGAEALSRWFDSEGKYRQPAEFIPILEKNGLIFQLDNYIWESAAKKLNQWKTDEKSKNLSISVNISPKDFYYGDLYKIFTGLVEKYSIDPKKLNLEITESVLIRDMEFHKAVLSRLKEYGFIIEMDDFGSGYSSLNTLKNLSMDVLKIDMAFLQRTENEERAALILNAIVKMAKKLGMVVITEGVENVEQENTLKGIGVDYFQGFLYAKPMSVKDFEHKYLGVKL